MRDEPGAQSLNRDFRRQVSERAFRMGNPVQVNLLAPVVILHALSRIGGKFRKTDDSRPEGFGKLLPLEYFSFPLAVKIDCGFWGKVVRVPRSSRSAFRYEADSHSDFKPVSRGFLSEP